MIFHVDHQHSDWIVNASRYSFGSLQKGCLKVKPKKHEDGTMAIVIDGIADNTLLCREAIPRSTQPGVSIAITWTESDVNIYLNGQKVKTILI